MKLIWLTDIHLNFLEVEGRKSFYKNIVDANGEAVLISGDIAEAPSVVELLNEMIDAIKKPIYFVLGNHDFYRGQIEEVRHAMAKLTQENQFLFWLPASAPKALTNKTLIVGQDGWSDGRLGDYANSRVEMNDSRLIADLLQARMYGKQALLDKMQQLADDDASQLRENLTQAIESNPEKIIILTHVPPFKEVCFHRGKETGDDFLPFYTCKAVGDVLIEFAQHNPQIEFLALCGHTHGKANYEPLVNLTVKVGGAEYFQPKVQEVITVD